MMNFLKFGMSESVSVSVVSEFDEQVTLSSENICVVNEDGDVLCTTEDEQPNWALDSSNRPDLTLTDDDLDDLAQESELQL